MKRINIIVLIIIIFNITLLQAYDWPIKEDTTQHIITSVMGECRSKYQGSVIVDSIHHFHRGIDISAPCSTKVYTIEGDTCYIDRINEDYGCGINIGHFRYYHMVIRGVIDDTSFIASDSFFAKTDVGNHVHIQEGDVILKHPGDLSYVHWLNPLRDSALTPYGDSLTSAYPKIRNDTNGIKFWRQGTNDTIPKDTISGRIDISVDARDPWTDSLGGGSLGGNMGIYKAFGYIFAKKDTQRVDTMIKFEHQRYDTCPPDVNVKYAYAPGSYTSRHIYFITNNPYDTIKPQNYYWNTKQKAGEPDSVDADSIEEAKFKDGYFWAKMHIYDIRNNADSESLYVHIDNFMPRVKQSFPLKDTTYSVIADRSTKLYLQFSEEMDTATLKISNIHINSLKDSHIYDIDSLSYYKDSSYLFIYMDTTFRLQDTVRLKLDTTITDLSGKPIKDSTGEYEIDFVVGLKQITDNDTDDAVASIYGDKIVWVYGNYNDDHSTFTGDIMEYDIKTGQTQMISNGTDHLFTRPYIYKDKVAYFYAGYYWTNAVLYYDEAGNTSIISHSSETRAGYSLQVGDSGIVWRGAYPGAGSTDTTFVFFYRYSDMTTHLLSQEVSEVYGIYAGTMSIDGDKITYNQPSPDSSWNIYIYNIGLMSELQLTHYHQYPEIYYYNPIISNGQISFEGEGGIGDSVRGIYTYDGSDILTVESKNDIYYSTNSPSLHRGHIVYPLLHSTSTKHTKFMNSIPFPKTSKNRLKERNAHYINRLKSNQFIIKQIKNREVNNQIQNSISLRNAISVNYLRYFDGRHNITIDQDTTSDFPYLCYKDWGTLYGYIYFIAEHPLTKGNEVCLISKSNEDLIKTNIWHDYSDSSHTPETGYRPIYKGNFVFSAYDGNDYELYLYMGDTTNCVPAVPEGLHYTTSTKSNDVQLYWNKAEDATLYRIYKSTDSHEYGSYLATTSDTFYIDTAITGNTMYYTISSMNGDNESGLSKQITVNEFDTIGPTAPESLRITNIDTVEMKLSLNWKKSISSDVEKYLIYKKTGIYGEFNIYDSTDKSITEYNDTNIQFGINYFYKTSAMDYRGNEGAYSNEVDTTIIHSSGICFRKSREFTIRYSTIQSNGIFLFKLINGKGKEIDTRIYDLGGRIIYRKIITPGNANVMEKANVKKNGIYFIEFRYDKKRYVKKIVIL